MSLPNRFRRPTLPMALAALALGGLSACMESDDSAAARAVTVTVKSKAPAFTSSTAGTYGAGAAVPGKSFTFDFYAPKGSRLSFASMFGQSNDLFFAPAGDGIPLMDGKAWRNGDVTGWISLWDAGTEANEAPGVGPNQAPRQSAPGMGGPGEGKVQAIGDVMDGFAYPKAGDLIEVNLKPR